MRNGVAIAAALALIMGCVEAQMSRKASYSVARAIEQTKRRQAYDKSAAAAADSPRVGSSADSKQKVQRPVRMERLDVTKLNNLIKSIDRTWQMPRGGSRDPVGSNFQYQKTCAGIFKSRNDACKQVGFAIMCFNYCHEQGEELMFRCEDQSDGTYCRNNANFGSFLSKHKKDAYKVKTYIHQMISRCYATAICTPSQSILNAIPMGGGKSSPSASPRDSAPSPMEQRTKAGGAMAKRLPTAAAGRSKVSAMQGKKPSIWERFSAQQPNRGSQLTQPAPSAPNAGFIGPADEDNSSKAVPFWQKLLKRKQQMIAAATAATSTPPSPPPQPKAENAALEEYDEEAEEEEEPTTTTTTTAATRKTRRRRLRPARVTTPPLLTTTRAPAEADGDLEAEFEEPELTESSNPQPPPIDAEPSTRHTFRPPDSTARPHSSWTHSEANHPPVPEGFWNKFQPGRWFQSIHYMTNTG